MRTPRPDAATRAVRLTAGALVAVALLAGCAGAHPDAGGDAEPTDGSEETSALMPEAEGQVEYPLAVETAWGEVTIEERPERVVAGSWRGDLSWLLALGVSPVAVESAEWAMEAVPWAEENLAEPIEHTWTYEELALEPEPIAASEPDLIVATSMGSEAVPNLEQLSSIAPVIAQVDNGVDYAGWREGVLLLGHVLDLQDRAQQVIDDYDTFFQDFRSEHPEFDGVTAGLIGMHGGESGAFYGNPPGSVINEFFTRMGLAENSDSAQFDENEALSPELVGTITDDIIVALDYTVPEDEGAEFNAWLESPLLQGTPAARAGDILVLRNPTRTVLVDADGNEIGPMPHPSVAYDDPIGSPQLAELLAPLLSETIAD